MKKKLFPIILLFLLSLLLVFLWFKDGFLLGAAESGLPFYNLERNEEIVKWSWAKPGLGNYTGSLTATWPTYWFLKQIENFGVSGVIIEAFVFWIFLFIGGIVVYLLIREFFPNIDEKFALLGVFFYWFNPFPLVNVWNRFLINFMFFYAFFPLSILIYSKGLNREKYYYSPIFALSSLVLSFAFSSLAFVMLFWFVIFAISFIYFFSSKNGKRLFYVKFFFLSLLLFSLVNFWWIRQVFGVYLSPDINVVTSKFASTSSNLDNLRAISNNLGVNINTTRFLHGTFFKEGQPWAKLFEFPVFVILEFLVSGIIFLTLLLYRKKKAILLFGFLFISGLFLMKGSSPPFGELFELVFVFFRPFQLFRNPFEKFGFLFLISSTLLFTFGVEKISNRIKSVELKNVFFGLLAVFILGFWGFPFWSKLAFSANERVTRSEVFSYDVEVPDYYKETNEWLKQKEGNFRFVSFPLRGEGIVYNWEKKYNGVELSYVLFDLPSISSNTTVPFYSDVAGGLEKFFLKSDSFDEELNKINARYVLVRKDIDWQASGMRDPNRILEIISSKPQKFKKVAEFDQISVWENLIWKDRRFYTSVTPVVVFPEPGLFDYQYLDGPIEDKVLLPTGLGDQFNSSVINAVERTFFIKSPVLAGFEARQDIFPHVRILPSNPLYKAILLKEKLGRVAKNTRFESVELEILLLGKRINEARLEFLKGNAGGAARALEIYREQLVNLERSYSKIPVEPENQQVWNQTESYKIFSRHINVLKEIESLIPKEVERTRDSLVETLVNIGVFPRYKYVEEERFPIENRVTYQFNIKEPGTYEMYFETGDWDSFFQTNPEKEMVFQVDESVVAGKGLLVKDALLSYGSFDFDSGVHEIGINTPEQVNLVDPEKEFNLEVEHGVGEVRLPIKNFDSFAKYEISLKYWIKRGSGLEFLVELNNDKTKEGERIPSFSTFLGPDSYNYYFQDYSFVFSPGEGTDKAEVVLRVKPWNNCESIYQSKGGERCKDEEFRKPYDRKTEVVITDIFVKKLITERPVLVKKFPGTVLLEQPKLSYRKINPAEYEVNITNAKNSFILVFSELFHSGWQVRLENDKKPVEAKHLIADGYANAWLIDEKGSYKLKLKFKLQDSLEVGRFVSLFSVLATFGIAVVLKKKEIE